jgi:hypothetical protein
LRLPTPCSGKRIARRSTSRARATSGACERGCSTGQREDPAGRSAATTSGDAGAKRLRGELGAPIRAEAIAFTEMILRLGRTPRDELGTFDLS